MSKTIITLRLEDKLEAAKEQLAEFTLKAQNGYLYAFSWADHAIAAAAMVEACKAALACLGKGATLEAEAARLRDKVRIGVLYPPKSSSPMSNICELASTQAHAQILELFE